MPISPIILYANRIQLAGRPDVINSQVHSRMLLRCLDGQAAIFAEGRRMTLRPGEFVLLPWRHSLRYFCRQSRAFYVDGIHLIPSLPPGREKPLQFAVAHHPGNLLSRSRHRRDAPLKGLEGLITGRFRPDSRFGHLCEHIIDCFTEGGPEEWQMRSLAKLFLHEMRRLVSQSESAPLPVELHQVVERVGENLREDFSVQQMSLLAGCSPATLNRLFRRHLKLSPVSWLIRQRMNRAAVLLATTGCPVSQVGRQVGVADPYYFSKLFRRCHHQTPLAYRKSHQWV